jgi:flap endonuclease-1
MGLPWVQAPSEAEAQAAFIASRGDVWAANSRDYDSILFGAPRLVRYLTISGREFLPSKGISRPLKPELIVLSDLQGSLGITHEQLVDIAILVGTDFNSGVKGIGPKTALKLLQRYGSLDHLPEDTRQKLPKNLKTLRGLFLHPNTTSDYSTSQQPVDEKKLISFLCEERGFSHDRVTAAIDRLRIVAKRGPEPDLGRWLSK